MTDEEIKQRIKYLIEHGGIYDDPIDAVSRRVRILSWLTTAACGFALVDLLLLLR
jgi:hypothetical protein